MYVDHGEIVEMGSHDELMKIRTECITSFICRSMIS